jgi:hypothetical protein
MKAVIHDARHVKFVFNNFRALYAGNVSRFRGAFGFVVAKLQIHNAAKRSP